MGPGGFGGLCLALLCSGAALNFQEEEPGTGIVTEVTTEGTPEPSEPPGHPSVATEDGDTVTPSSPWSRDPAVTPVVTTEVTPAVTPAVTPVVTPAVTTAGNQTRASSGVPARYWSPVIFVVLALLVLFVTYHRTKDKGIRDGVMSGSDSSDLGALVQPNIHEPTPKIPSPKIPTLHREEKDPETPPGPEFRETSFGHSDTPDSLPSGS